MAANPALVRTFDGDLVPAPFASELIVLKRPKVGFELDGVHTRTGKWSATGAIFLSNIRLVFVADKPDASGLAAFDLPLVYIGKEQLNQPLFGCNNLAGEIWPAVPGGGPGGQLPPHKFKVMFKDGGMGTLYPLFYALRQRAQRADAAARQAEATGSNALAANSKMVQEMVHKAFVDPSDPSTVYLTQPTSEEQRLNYTPAYAPNYGQDEKYEPMGLRP